MYVSLLILLPRADNAEAAAATKFASECRRGDKDFRGCVYFSLSLSLFSGESNSATANVALKCAKGGWLFRIRGVRGNVN